MNKKIPRLLVVDDDKDFCTIVMNKLADIFTIRSVSNLSEAMEHLARYDPDVMLLDNHLPDGLGAEFVKQCVHQNPSVKIIMVSADGDPELKRQTLESGASLFLLKPFDIRALRESTLSVLTSSSPSPHLPPSQPGR